MRRMPVQQRRIRIRTQENAGPLMDRAGGVPVIDFAFGFGDEGVVAVALDFGKEEVFESAFESWIGIEHGDADAAAGEGAQRAVHGAGGVGEIEQITSLLQMVIDGAGNLG